MKNFDLTMYYVTDRSLLHPNYDLKQSIEAAILGGATLIQIREKDMDTRDFYKESLEIKEICHKYKVPLIINDRLDVAQAVDADGVHLGQSDMPVEVARKILGEDKIIGISASNLEEAIEAEKGSADYLGVGAMYSTATKTDANLTSIEELAKIKKEVKIPICAIGGINEKTIPSLKQAQIDGLAIVSAISLKEDTVKGTRNLKNIFLRQFKTKAAIFDLDGTLANTMGIWDKILEKLFSNFNIKLTKEVEQKLWTMEFEESTEYIVKKYNLNVTKEEFKEKLMEISAQEYRNSNIEIKKGAVEFLEYLKANNIKLAIATSLSKVQYTALLENIGLTKYFPVIVSSIDNNLLKSDKRFYEIISEKLNVDTRNCIIFEDDIYSGPGIKESMMEFCLMKNHKYNPDKVQLRFVDYSIEDFTDEKLKEEIIIL